MKAAVQKRDPLVGVWRAPSEWSNIEYRIARRQGRYSVTARDFEDDERADVFEVKWSAKLRELSFASYWNSTGRFLRCRVKGVSQTQLDLTFTYTEMQPLVRHPGELHNQSKDPAP